MKYFGLVTLSLVLACGSAAPAFAHHSNAPHFDNNVDISVDAVVTRWAFVNPHAYIFFEGTNENGETAEWRCETSSATSMKRRGFDENTFVPGQKMTIEGNPARREDNVCWINGFVFEDGVAVGGRDDLPEDKRSGTVQEVAATIDTERTEYLENGQPNISGAWVRGGRGGGQAGEEIGLTAAAKAVQAEYEFIYDVPAIHCDIGNIFFGWTHDSHVNEITQFEDRILMQYGYMDYLRTIHLDMDSHPDNIVLTRGGHSIGHWEDNTLVVDTIGFTPGFLAFQTGIPHSDQMHSVERIWYDDETKTLIQSYVADDPAYLNNSYTGQTSMQLSAIPYELYNCTEFSGDNNKRPDNI